MKRTYLLSLASVSILGAAGLASAAEQYVDAGNLTGNESGSKQAPFRTVQRAIDSAGGGDVIRVAAGTYIENLRIVGKAITLQGGFSRDWTRDPAANPTTLQGAGGNAVINLIEADATIDGFRITGGTGSIEELPYGYHGGGIYSRDGSPTISNNIIEGNDVRSGEPPFDTNFGGGVRITNAASATILNNVIRANTAGRGGGIAVFGQNALIQGNTIENNVAVGDHGGGVFLGVANARVTQNVIRGNEVGRELGYGWGGGLIVVNQGNSAELSYNVLYRNFAAAYGSAEFIDEGAHAEIHHELIYRNLSKDGCEAVSAIAVDGGEGVGSEATIRNCTVVGNVCESAVRGNGLQVEGRSAVSVSNCIFWNNGGDDFAADNTSSLRIAYTCSEEPMAGTGNISVDPRFVNPNADDFRLAAGSPCIDAGDPATPVSSDPAAKGGRADLGRFSDAADAPAAGGAGTDATPNGNANSGSGGAADNGNANSIGAANDNSGRAAEPASDEAPVATGDTADAVSSTAACPSASALLLSISLIGARQACRRRPNQR